MNERDIEQDLLDFFSRSATPEPSVRLRAAVSGARVAPAGRAATFRAHRTLFSLAGLAATFVIAVASLLVVVNVRRTSPPATVAACSTAPAVDRPSSVPTASSPAQGGTFTSTGSMATGRAGFTATLLCDGRVLVAGGISGSPLSTFLASAEVYNPATGAFAPTGAMAAARQGATATRLRDGRVMVAGGIDASGEALSSAELYDPTTGTFSATGSMTAPRLGQSAVLLTDGRVLIAGGGTDAKTAASAELYDPATGTFSLTGSMTGIRSGVPSTLLADGRVLIAGGDTSADGIPLPTAELYDPKTGTFSRTGPTLTPLISQTATLLSDGRVLMAGGGGTSGVTSAAEVYDPATGKFSATGSMTLGRVSHIATPLPDGLVLIAGGSTLDASGGNTSTTATVELYSPKTGLFSATGSMSTARAFQTATVLPDGRVLIVGGEDTDSAGKSAALASAELYQP